ncbi:hypothetical protein HYX17_02560 [Candidatus Woesearchaeota archaeon]|nr:hypothetical protein [Candidatus Woesearchaeota archaeon]
MGSYLNSTRIETKEPSGSCIVCLNNLPNTYFKIRASKKEIGNVCSNDCEAVVWNIAGVVYSPKKSILDRLNKIKIILENRVKYVKSSKKSKARKK